MSCRTDDRISATGSTDRPRRCQTHFRRWSGYCPSIKSSEWTITLGTCLSPAAFLLLLLLLEKFIVQFGAGHPAHPAIVTLASVPSICHALLFGLGPRGAGNGPLKSRFSFDPRNFDVAAMGGVSEELEKALNTCAHLCRLGPNDPGTIHFIANGQKPTVWGGTERMYINLARFLSVPESWISLHDRTTAALEFALRDALGRLRRNNGSLKLMMTDCEYPEIMDRLVPEIAALHGLEVHIAPVQSLIWSQRTRAEFTERILTEANTHQPDIVILSHVLFTSGFVVDIAAIAKGLRALSNEVVIIVDGAQAVGNIEVTGEILHSVEYYATCGHKWLLTPPSLGILVWSEELLRNRHGTRALPRPSSPHASYRIAPHRYGQTVSLSPLFALNAMLEEGLLSAGLQALAKHNGRLAEMLRRELRHLDPDILIGSEEGAIVSLLWEANNDLIQQRLARQKISCAVMDTIYEGKPRRALRVAVHGFHGERDVRRLIHSIATQRSHCTGTCDPYGGNGKVQVLRHPVGGHCCTDLTTDKEAKCRP
jgi:selenocysteine lyase/cysteine desulfurase